MMTTKVTKQTPTSPATLDAFLDQLATQLPSSGRLVFALDATASRQPTWDTACTLQSVMFAEAAASGNLEIQLVYYRGARGECLELDSRSETPKHDHVTVRVRGRLHANR
jgi:hypothetical protein